MFNTFCGFVYSVIENKIRLYEYEAYLFLSKKFYNIVHMLHHVVQKDVFVLSFHTKKIQFESNLAWGKQLKRRNISNILMSMQ